MYNDVLYFDEKRSKEQYVMDRLNSIEIQELRIPGNTVFYNVISTLLNDTVEKIADARELCEDSGEEMTESEIYNIGNAFISNLSNQILGYNITYSGQKR